MPFLKSLGSDDPRFKILTFHKGMNLVLAEKTHHSSDTDSRNGAGKTSVVRLLRYLLGGKRNEWIKSLAEYTESAFWADVQGTTGNIRIRREAGSTSVSVGTSTYSSNEWREKSGELLLGWSASHEKPTAQQVFSQLLRTSFDSPTKIDSYESDLETGTRIAYFLGIPDTTLQKPIQAANFKKDKKTLKKAIEHGILGNMAASKAECEAELFKLEDQLQKRRSALSEFKVDESYAGHQQAADELSAEIAALNDQNIALKRRKRDLANTMSTEIPAKQDNGEMLTRLKRLYAEAGVTIAIDALKPFSDVVQFHESVSRNRRHFLEDELGKVSEALMANEARIKMLDNERSGIMRLLDKSMALETFSEAQQDCNEIAARIERLKDMLQDYERLDDMDSTLRKMEVEANDAMRLGLKESSGSVKLASQMYSNLCSEVYSDRAGSLLLEPTAAGVLKVTPKIEGDASKGIAEVSIFLFDITCVAVGMKNGTVPGILVHDSQLFDSMDDRQLASCLNIGARLAEEYGFQYIVTLNTDRLEAAEKIGFDRSNYPIPVSLTDSGESGGLFGFRFN
ncbi:MAG: DUF2326 domain-containing protein [Olsenella sp.]|jgi:uncharacterized protein YydD (DUF2326 family)|nr:DUF2326 domain-containing protein [Olsenella sp.]